MKLLKRVPVKLPDTCESIYFPYSLLVESKLPKLYLMACFILGNIRRPWSFDKKFEVLVYS